MVAENGSAFTSGKIRVGTLITKVDNITVTALDQVQAALMGPVGSSLRVALRNPKIATATTSHTAVAGGGVAAELDHAQPPISSQMHSGPTSESDVTSALRPLAAPAPAPPSAASQAIPPATRPADGVRRGCFCFVTRQR